MHEKSDGKFLTWFLSLERLKNPVRDSLWKVPTKQTQLTCVVSHHLCCPYVNNHTKLNESGLILEKKTLTLIIFDLIVITIERKIMFQWKTIMYPCGFHVAHFTSHWQILSHLVSSSIWQQLSKLTFPCFLLSDLESLRIKPSLFSKSLKLKLNDLM